MKYIIAFTILLNLIVGSQAFIEKSAICGDAEYIAGAGFIAEKLAAFQKCGGNEACVRAIYKGSGVQYEKAITTTVGQFKQFVKMYYIHQGKSPQSAAALARWWGVRWTSNFGNFLFMVGPLIEFYCSDTYSEGACAASGNALGAWAGGQAGLYASPWCGAWAGACAIVGGIGGAIGGAVGGAMGGRFVCEQLMII